MWLDQNSMGEWRFGIIDLGINKSDNYTCTKTKDLYFVSGKITQSIYLPISVICFPIYTIITPQRLQAKKSE